MEVIPYHRHRRATLQEPCDNDDGFDEFEFEDFYGGGDLGNEEATGHEIGSCKRNETELHNGDDDLTDEAAADDGTGMTSLTRRITQLLIYPPGSMKPKMAMPMCKL